MRKIVLIAVAALAFVACNNQGKKAADEKTAKEAAVMSIDKFFEDADGLVGETVVVKGDVDHVCKHGGKRMFLVGSTPENRLKITTGENISSFDVAYEGSTLTVKGKVDMLKMDSTYLANWEKELIEGAHEEGEGHGDGEGHQQEEGEEHADHDHTSHGEKADMGEHIPGMEKVKNYQQEIKENGKGYIPIFSVVATEVKTEE